MCIVSITLLAHIHRHVVFCLVRVEILLHPIVCLCGRSHRRSLLGLETLQLAFFCQHLLVLATLQLALLASMARRRARAKETASEAEASPADAPHPKAEAKASRAHARKPKASPAPAQEPKAWAQQGCSAATSSSPVKKSKTMLDYVVAPVSVADRNGGAMSPSRRSP